MTVIKKKIFQKSWFHGGGGGLIAGACCLPHALAVAVGFGAGAALSPPPHPLLFQYFGGVKNLWGKTTRPD